MILADFIFTLNRDTCHTLTIIIPFACDQLILAPKLWHWSWLKCSHYDRVHFHKAQILADREEAIAIVSSNYYATKRAAEYPPIGDQLDALWKGGEAAAEMLSKVQAVKTKYPKPE